MPGPGANEAKAARVKPVAVPPTDPVPVARSKYEDPAVCLCLVFAAGATIYLLKGGRGAYQNEAVT